MNPAWRSIATVTLTALAATRAWGQSVTAPRSGIDTQFFDTRVRPQDDFYQYVNGKWLATTDIPSDRPAYGVAIQLYDDAQRALGEIIQEAAEHPDNAPGSDAAKVAALYKSFMDEPRVESLGSQPLADDLSRILGADSAPAADRRYRSLQRIGAP